MNVCKLTVVTPCTCPELGWHANMPTVKTRELREEQRVGVCGSSELEFEPRYLSQTRFWCVVCGGCVCGGACVCACALRGLFIRLTRYPVLLLVPRSPPPRRRDA
jgi:hypothetical protein